LLSFRCVKIFQICALFVEPFTPLLLFACKDTKKFGHMQVFCQIISLYTRIFNISGTNCHGFRPKPPWLEAKSAMVHHWGQYRSVLGKLTRFCNIVTCNM